MIERRTKVEVGSGNVFADLGLPDADEMLLKSTIVVELGRLIKQRKLTQIAAARLIGVSQAHLAKILRGDLGHFPARLSMLSESDSMRILDLLEHPPRAPKRLVRAAKAGRTLR
jgi:predicted XRE-type DNA-binding protein